ncbi:hypothetical protein BCR39DRAFT_517260 [Naematelia encephala]|uniref:t-SNARE coiled-coil homology domain-containing protein n=1 Tax=Naematelia encephala TaxID=71784 RepID=A0A1Y2BJF3_9TREE|nr:hypothetical protein BCR39DRAFT_517260 [Naematelia encephala]
MSFFKRNKESLAIPPVAQPSEPKADPYAARSTEKQSDPYARNGTPVGGDPYAKKGAAGGGGGGDPYASSAAGRDPLGGKSNPYAKAVDPADQARNELFAGYNAPEKPQSDRKLGYDGREEEPDFDPDEEAEAIKSGMRELKQDSLASTRNALRLAREAEDSARGTIAKLADQSESIANSERYLDKAKANNLRAVDKADELKQLRRSIFRPVVVWNKDAKRAAQEQKIDERHTMERADRAKALEDISDTRQRLGQATNPSPYGRSERAPMPGEQKARRDARARYQFEATASDDELEDELDENLDETHEVVKRLKNLAQGMNSEVTKQNTRLTRVTDKTEDLEYGLEKTTDQLRRIK